MESSTNARHREQVRNANEAALLHGVAGQEVGRLKGREEKGEGLLVLACMSPHS